MDAPRDAPADAPLAGFGATKRALLETLKREGPLDLGTLSGRLAISKAAVHKHVAQLEARGLVERTTRRGAAGRPALLVRLSPQGGAAFPRAYASITCAALGFIERKLGRAAVEAALRERQREVAKEYAPQLEGGSLGERVRGLAALRDAEGYMAESRKAGKGFELVEHNCPILAVAEQYGEACEVERELFARVLQARVETTHRVVAGQPLCRFVIAPRRET